MGRIAFTDYIQESLQANSPTSTLAAEAVTGLPIGTGARQGVSVYLTEGQAVQLSALATALPNNFISLAPLTFHAGWYRIVQVDTAATAANVGLGLIGAQLSVALFEHHVTDFSHVLNAGIAPCLFLNSITPNNYGFVQDAGVANVLIAANQTVAVGSLLVGTTGGLLAVAGGISDTVFSTFVAIAMQAVTTPASLTLSAVAASSGGTAVYTGTITGGGSNAFAGMYFVIAGFTTAANNGVFYCSASSGTTLTLSNAVATAETHAGTAVSQAYVQARLGFPFGQNM